jgi:hypothetical protein
MFISNHTEKVVVGLSFLIPSFFIYADSTDYVSYPFASDSIWKIGIGDEATYQDKTDAESTMISNPNVGGTNYSYPWVSGSAMGVYQASSTDTLATWTYLSRPGSMTWPFTGSSAGGTFTMRTPSSVQFLSGSDGHAIIVAPDKTHALEVWKGSYNSSTGKYSASYVVYTEIDKTGISKTDGISEGIRAFGGSLMGGLVRKSELDALKIDHAIAMALSQTQLKAGSTLYDQKVWPATYTDGGGNNSYAGLIPMGALFAIPKTTTIASLNLQTNEGKALARAFKYYGGYVVDSATKTTVLAYLENGCTSTQLANLQADRRTILKNLVMVTDNSETEPGGPGTRLVDEEEEFE